MAEAKLYGQNKGGMSINGIIKDYYAYAGENISAGDLVEYINGVAGEVNYGISENIQISSQSHLDPSYDGISAVALDNNRIFITYPCTTNYYWYGMIVTIEGATINLGTEVQLQSSTKIGANTSMLLLPNGNIFVAHTYPSYNYLYATVISINGEEITVGTTTQLCTKKASGSYISTVLLPNGNVFVAHSYNSSNYLYGIVATISGTTITVGTDMQLGSQKTGLGISSICLSNGNVFIAHNNYAMICTISGTTITAGTDVQIIPSGVQGIIKAKLISDNKILFVHGDASYYLCGAVCTISDSTISVGTSTVMTTESHSGDIIPELVLIKGMIFIGHNSNRISNYSVHAQMFDIDEANNIPTNNVTGIGYETQIRKVTTGQFDGVAKTSGTGGDSTGHNDLVSIWTLE